MLPQPAVVCAAAGWDPQVAILLAELDTDPHDAADPVSFLEGWIGTGLPARTAVLARAAGLRPSDVGPRTTESSLWRVVETRGPVPEPLRRLRRGT